MIANGTTVTVKATGHWANGEWGIVKGFDGSNYHVALFGGNDTQLVFSRKELTVKFGGRLVRTILHE